jgi:ribonuclease BN (tRNA processing enzyme)
MAEPLTLVPVGVGAAYGRPGEAQSAYLVAAGERRVCLDLGAGTFNLLQALVRPERLDAVLVSHLHPDHCADLFALRVYMVWGPGAGSRVRLWGPPGLRDRLVAFAGEEGWDEAIAFATLEPPGGELDLGGGLRLRYAEVPHLHPTFAVRVDWAGRSVCYGADCAPNEVLPRLASGCDILVAECSFGAGGSGSGASHLDAREAAAMARAAGVRRLLLTHCYPEFDRDAALEAARSVFPGPVEWAEAGRAVRA